MSEIVTLIFSGIVALSTVVYAILTWRLSAETIKMRKAQTEPRVAIYLEQNRTSFHFVDLIIRNVGAGPAYDVTFKVLEELDVPEERKLSDIDFIQAGIKYMPPDYQLRSYFLTFLGHYEKVIDEKLTLQVSYKNSDKKDLTEVISLNMSQFKGLQMLGEDTLNKIAKSIESIGKDIHHIATGFNHLAVDVYDSKHRGRITEDRNKH